MCDRKERPSSGKAHTVPCTPNRLPSPRPSRSQASTGTSAGAGAELGFATAAHVPAARRTWLLGCRAAGRNRLLAGGVGRPSCECSCIYQVDSETTRCPVHRWGAAACPAARLCASEVAESGPAWLGRCCSDDTGTAPRVPAPGKLLRGGMLALRCIPRGEGAAARRDASCRRTGADTLAVFK